MHINEPSSTKISFINMFLNINNKGKVQLTSRLIQKVQFRIRTNYKKNI